MRSPPRLFGLLPFTLFASTLIATVTAAIVTRDSLDIAARARLELVADDASERLKERLESAGSVARATAGLFVAQDKVTSDTFHAFVGAQAVTRWLGEGKIAWVSALRPGDEQALLAQGRAEWPGYQLASSAPLFPVLYVSPKSKNNEPLLGLDLGAEPSRRASLERARDEGEMVLVGDFDFPLGAPGTAVLHPVYSGTPTSVEDRRAQLKGVVLVVVPTDALLASAFEGSLTAFHVETKDLTNSAQRWSSPDFPSETGPEEGVTRVVAFGGKKLAVHLVPRSEASTPVERYAFVSILAVGTMLAFSFAGLTLQQLRGRRTAERAELATRAAYDERERLIVALEFSNAELEQFASVASHDLKAPLRGIAQLAQFLEEDLGDKLSEENRQHLSLLVGRVRRLSALIDGILNYARAGQSSETLETFDARDAAQEALVLIAPPPGSEVQLPAAGVKVHGDKALLLQVLMNLLSNAFTHGKKNGSRIVVDAREEGAMVRFSVKDDGPGIDPQYHQRIWNMFQTLQPRDEKESTGIGLSVVRKVVQAQGGRAWVESALGEGATFFFTWPRWLGR